MAPARSFARSVAGYLSRRRAVVVYTVVGSGEPVRFPAGAKLVCPDGLKLEVYGLQSNSARALRDRLPETDPEAEPGIIAVELAAEPASTSLTLYRECLMPPLQCVIVGAGHIARVLATIADSLGWSVAVVDDRSDYADPRFFPEGTRVECVAFADAFERVCVDAATAVVLVTRGHKHDEACLRALTSYSPCYIGMIGSRRRVANALAELHASGVPEAFTQRVYAPVGLPVGAKTPGEIALAIAAEIVATRRGRRDWARREKQSYYDLP